MARVDSFEVFVRRTGAIALLATFIPVVAGLVSGSRRSKGRTTGAAGRVLRLPIFFIVGILYLGACVGLWRGFRSALPVPLRLALLVVGSLLYFPGLALVMWGRLTLGNMYNVSSGFGVQLYAEHRLITGGPYAYVRHPMYLGLVMASAGGLLLYRTWTLLFVLSNAVMVLFIRGVREEQALASEFGAQWQAYRAHVPLLIPRGLRGEIGPVPEDKGRSRRGGNWTWFGKTS